jgi:hypothetical protein
MIEAHAIESDLDVGRPSEVVAAIHGEHLKIPLCDVRHAYTINAQG